MIPSFAQKHLFYAEMSKLLEAGFGILQAADVMWESQLPRAQEAMLEGLAEGKSITESLGRDREEVSDLERSLIGAGERGGHTAPAKQYLAAYFAMLDTAR